MKEGENLVAAAIESAKVEVRNLKEELATASLLLSDACEEQLE